MTDRARSEFNTWWERQPFKDQFADVKGQMGNVWVASREECVVELPTPEGYMADVQKYSFALCAQRIRSAGLKVKP